MTKTSEQNKFQQLTDTLSTWHDCTLVVLAADADGSAIALPSNTYAVNILAGDEVVYADVGDNTVDASTPPAATDTDGSVSMTKLAPNTSRPVALRGATHIAVKSAGDVWIEVWKVTVDA